ncbi:MAG: two pore domain potassium channel family protein [Candidatus Eremiobacteraeota bacterium]|nr:two pore domain potassium channel family protein [Candidatus Eremiobacteraeota bacterium]
MKILGATMHRRGLAYALLLTATVTFVGAAGMYAFERNLHGGPGINSYGDSIWWTAMVMTTLGSDYFPHTVAGRILCFMLSVFAFSVFGYVTASISSYFINRDADDSRSDVPSAKQLAEVLAEVRALRASIEDRPAKRAVRGVYPSEDEKVTSRPEWSERRSSRNA